MVAIIDYDAGNLRSVQKAVELLGKETIVTRNPEQLLQADHVILPGVGCFKDAMERLTAFGLVEPIHEIVRRNIPFLGICLGLQLFFDESEESPGVSGLSLLSGKIKQFPSSEEWKVPHMGWNSITFPKESVLFKGITPESYVYFVHSFYLEAQKREVVAASSEYILAFDAAVEQGNLFATQFHPEKSGDVGLKILENFCNC